jgi:hypothetical protein
MRIKQSRLKQLIKEAISQSFYDRWETDPRDSDDPFRGKKGEDRREMVGPPPERLTGVAAPGTASELRRRRRDLLTIGWEVSNVEVDDEEGDEIITFEPTGGIDEMPDMARTMKDDLHNLVGDLDWIEKPYSGY